MNTILAARSWFLLALAAASLAVSTHGQPTAGTLPDGVESIRDVNFGSGGERALTLHILRPQPLPKDPMPVVVFIYGGAWRSGSRDAGLKPLSRMAEQGYFCASIEYRLSQEAIFPGQIEDCKCAIRFLRAKAKEYNLDPDHIGVWGPSAGGHLAALLGTTGGVKEFEGRGGWPEFSSRVRAVVDWFGPTDFLQMNTAGSTMNHDASDSPESRLIGGPIQENRNKVAKANPISYVTPDDPPFLIMHGDNDPLVPFHQSELLLAALQKAGVEVALHRLPGAGHGGAEFNTREVMAMIVKFFDRHLKTKRFTGAMAGGGKGANPSNPRQPVVLTTDCGADMDDQWALAQLALAPELELLGVVTTHAPQFAKPSAETSARIAREVLDHLPLKQHPPVLVGSSVPLANKASALMNPGVEFILQQSHRFSATNRLTVLVVGAATDAASALLADPTLGERMEILAMAFNEWPKGDDLFNVKNDLKAWQILLESRAPIVVGAAAVCLRDLSMNREQARILFAKRGDAGQYLFSLLTAWLDKHGDLVIDISKKKDTWPIWDSVTVAHLLGFTQSKVYSRPMLGDNFHFIHLANSDPARTITWITTVDSQRLWQHFTANLDRARIDGPSAKP